MSKRRATGRAKTRKPQRPGTGRRRFRKVLLWLLAVGLAGLLFAVGAFVYVYQTTEMPDPNEDFLTETTKVYYSGGQDELGSFATQKRESVTLAEMSPLLQDAVISAEDRSFWTNRGIDPRGIVRAAFNNAQGGSTQGASTITQQYVKILYLTNERSLSRKVKEAVLSLKVHRTQSKEQILEGYLNTIYFGRGAYGVQAASQAYFNTTANDLNLRQSAVLASVLNDPTDLDPANGREAREDLKARFSYVLEGMAEMGSISEAEAAQAARRLPKFPEIPAESQYGGQRGHMLTLVRDELHDLDFTDAEIDGGGLRITTTFTEEAMDAAEDGVLAQRPEGFKDKQLHIAAASVEPSTGALRGFYGGQDYLDSQINWAKSGGMAGSTFKINALVAAIRDGFSLKDTFDGNSPIVLSDGLDFENQGNASYGSAINMITATENSVNTAFIDMVNSMENGPSKVLRAARDLGIPSSDGSDDFGIPSSTVDLEPVLGIPLGTAQVSPINMANAYATIAAGGQRADVHVIEEVQSRSGETLYQFKSPTERTVNEDIAADVSYALQQVVKSGSGTAALALNRPAAGKTGTATNAQGEVSSAWFVGYTPQLSTAVMYVRGKGREQLEGWLPEYFGGSYPARTWTAIMTTLMDGLPIVEFPEPVYVDGEAPDEGHAPTVAPPKPSKTKKPTKSPPSSPAPSSDPPSEEPTEEPSSPPPSSPPPSSPPPSPSNRD